MEWIDNIILGLVENYGTRNVYELCDALEIEIREVNEGHILLHKHQAFYYRYFDDKEIIFINNQLEYPLKDFILKHELGHAICHADILSAGFKLRNTGKLERQANYFALKLSDIKFDKVALDGFTLEQISIYTKVPYEVLEQLNTYTHYDKELS